MDLHLFNILPPKTLVQERYRVVRLIGRGGMGAVYEATDLRLKLSVALKQTMVGGAQLRKAFQREALILARLRHAALPVVTDYFAEGDAQFLVMQFIPGLDLATSLAKRGSPFPLAEVLDWADQLLRVLAYLHEQQAPVIHRDIKPQNLKLTTTGELVLLDFGLAKGIAAQSQAVSSSLFGYTPHYAPLEQIRGSGTSARSDLYALAATLYHLLTNTPPINAMERAEASINDLPDPLVPPHQANPQVATAVSDVLMRALALRTDTRPASANEMRAALHAATASAKDSEQTTVIVAPATGAAEEASASARLADESAGAPDASVRPSNIPNTAAIVAQPTRWQGIRWLWALGGTALLGLILLAIPGLRPSSNIATPEQNQLEIARTNTPTPTPTRTLTPTATPTRTPRPTWTATPTPSPTLTPTITSRPTAKPRPKSTSTPAPPTATPQPPTQPPTAAPTEQPTAQPAAQPGPRRPNPKPTAASTEQPTTEPTSEAYPPPQPPDNAPTDTPASTNAPAATSTPAPTKEPTSAPPTVS